jgi:hypothetical protein
MPFYVEIEHGRFMKLHSQQVSVAGFQMFIQGCGCGGTTTSDVCCEKT